MNVWYMYHVVHVCTFEYKLKKSQTVHDVCVQVLHVVHYALHILKENYIVCIYMHICIYIIIHYNIYCI